MGCSPWGRKELDTTELNLHVVLSHLPSETLGRLVPSLPTRKPVESFLP